MVQTNGNASQGSCVWQGEEEAEGGGGGGGGNYVSIGGQIPLRTHSDYEQGGGGRGRVDVSVIISRGLELAKSSSAPP